MARRGEAARLNFKSMIENKLITPSKTWHTGSMKRGINLNRTMTLIIIYTTFVLAFGALELTDALSH